jgi:hypothetical protein
MIDYWHIQTNGFLQGFVTSSRRLTSYMQIETKSKQTFKDLMKYIWKKITDD